MGRKAGNSQKVKSWQADTLQTYSLKSCMTPVLENIYNKQTNDDKHRLVSATIFWIWKIFILWLKI